MDEFVEAMAATSLTVTTGGVTTTVDTGLSYTVIPGNALTSVGYKPWNIFGSFDPPLDLDGLKKGLYLINGIYEAEASLKAQLIADPGQIPRGVTVEKLKMKEDAMAMLIQACIHEALDSHVANPHMDGVGHPPEGDVDPYDEEASDTWMATS
jgi:hypothetical protein